MKSSSPSAQASKLRLAVLLLAAGEGSRLGGYPKALLRQEKHTLLERFSIAIQQLAPVECLVVTGFHAEAIELEMAKINATLTFPLKTVRNITPEKGQASSVRLGLESLQSEFDVLLVALSDQAQIGALEIQELLEAFSRRNPGEEIILPMVDGQRGNPVLFSKAAVQAVIAIPGIVCRTYMDMHPEMVRSMQTQNPAFVMDVDTPQDILKYKLSLP